MSKLARTLVLAAMVSAMSLGVTGLAQAAVPAQQADTASPTSTPPQSTPTDTTTPTPPQPNPTPPAPGPTTTATTTHPPMVKPKSLPVTVSPRAGVAGNGVTVRADLRGCTQPGSAHGFFQEAHEWGVDGLSKRLESERVSEGRWYTGEYFLTERDPAGLGRFGVVCDNSIVGYATFQVHKWPGSQSVTLSRRTGRPGDTVTITADVGGGCDPANVFFQDRKDRANGNAKPVTILRLSDRQLVARYTVSSSDAVGWGRFGVSCNMRTDSYRLGYVAFHVLAAGGGPGGSGGNQTGDPSENQLPKRIDTGQGGTADGTSQGGLDPVSLLPAAGLLLIVLAAGLWLRQTIARRRP